MQMGKQVVRKYASAQVSSMQAGQEGALALAPLAALLAVHLYGYTDYLPWRRCRWRL